MEQEKDKRFKLVGEKINSGRIKRFSEIFKLIPKSLLAATLRKNASALDIKQGDPYFFRAGEVIEIADLMGVEPCKLFALMEIEIRDLKSRRLHTSRHKTGHTPAFMKKASQAQKLLATKKYSKTELAAKMNVSRNQLYKYLNYKGEKG
ncbi:helix-turn-helix domain-containing protein [Paraflavisolibacter sp. H34]|uniref:helix-turn-helix domain-containing protein n=1 Tax=Huijunlia imazamoxiresistens TaxID=3127457 RepID=UPI003018EF7C